MAGVRLIVQTTSDSAQAAEERITSMAERCRKTEAEEDGCIQYEVFRSAMNPNKTVLLEHWASQEALDKHLRLLRSGSGGPRPGAAGSTNLEVYEQKPGALPAPPAAG